MILQYNVLLCRQFLGICTTIFVFFLGGCQTTDDLEKSLTSLTNDLFSSSETVRVSLAETPPEAKAVSAALLMRLRGEEAQSIKKTISVSNADVFPALNPELYADWQLHGIDIRNIEPVSKTPNETAVSGLMYLRGRLDRGLILAFFGNIAKSNGGYNLQDGFWTAVSPIDPRTEFFIVPLEKMQPPIGNSADYKTLYEYVKNNAVYQTASEIPEDYGIYVFLKDFAASNDSFTVSISDVPEGIKGFTDNTRYHRFDDGWIAARVTGRFAIDRGKAFWIKAVFTPEGEDARVIGLYSTGPLSGS
jgi:hypothetical protein